MSENPPRARARGADPVLEVDGLSKSFGERVALRDVTLDVRAGELLAVLGPNGAGKTTLLSILAGITRPDSGRITTSNGDVGWVPQQAGVYRRLTVEENLRLFSHMEGVTDVEGTVDRMLDQTGLTERRHDPVSSLSGGNQQRINIAIGLLGDPPVLLLDEPTHGLDPLQVVAFRDLVRELRPNRAILLSSHVLAEVAESSDRLLAIERGRIVLDRTLADLRASAGPGSASVEAQVLAAVRAGAAA